jgi:shikimate dehydrogenase
MIMGDSEQVVSLLGWPVAHSHSPAMQNAAFAAAGLPWQYDLWPTPPDELAATVARLRDPAVRGANVTVPHKTAIMALLDEITADAQAIGAVNTIVHDGARLVGYNTDSAGFWQALVEAGAQPAGGRVVILGAGGAARAAAWALLTHGLSVSLLARRADEARALTAEFATHGQIAGAGLTAATFTASLHRAVLLVNATPAGMEAQADESPLPPGVRLPAGLLVYDLIYRPQPTRLLREAAAQGCRTLDGLAMLLYQGAAAFTLWTGQPAPVEVMRAALEQALREA